MLFLAVTTGLDKIKAAPPAFWWKLGGAVLGLIIVVIVIQQIAKVNKMVLAIIALIVFSVVGVNWIYERNEPAFLTPVIDKIAPFLPSKGSYGNTQKKDTLPSQTPPPKK
jgi:hypothetical protein